MRKAWTAMILGGFTAASIALVPIPAAGQAACPTRHLFVYNTGGNEAISWGQATTNRIIDINPDPNCNFSNRHGTAHVRDFLDANAGIAEVGWIRANFPPERTYFFVAVRPPFEAQTIWYFDLGNLVNVWYRFKVQSVDFTTTWRFFVDDDLNGASPTELCPFYPVCGVNAEFNNGYPMGETARVGNIPAGDRHTNLWSRNNVAQWNPWGGQALEVPTEDIVGYHWHRNSNTEYVVHVPEAQHAN